MEPDESPDESYESYEAREASPTRGLPVVGPAHMLPVQVIDRQEDVAGVVSLFIVLPGTEQAPAPYLPGQFVTLALPTPRETLYRAYSLCGAGKMDRPWELTIKRMRQGAVSTYFYDSVRPGTLLYSSLPRGTFTLPVPVTPDMHCVFVAAGSGITPIMGMLRALARLPEEQRPLAQLHYASRSPDDIIFRDELWELDPDETWLRQWHYLSSRGERMTAPAIVERMGRATARAHWYMCGPEPLKRELQAHLAKRSTPERQIHFEVFAAQAAPAYRVDSRTSGAEGGALRIVETGAVLDAQPHETLLTALERHGYRPDFNCRVGVCGTCRLKMVSGEVDVAGEMLSATERAAGYVLSCIAHPLGEVTLASGGRPPAGVARVSRVAGDARPRGAVAATRLVALAGASALALGAWGLTNHRPASWPPVIAAVQAPHASLTAAPSASVPPGATATHPAAAPTSTTVPGGPTATPQGPSQPTPTATPRPRPTPTATSTPSPAH
jgi:ferredoxin-NADP reductase